MGPQPILNTPIHPQPSWSPSAVDEDGLFLSDSWILELQTLDGCHGYNKLLLLSSTHPGVPQSPAFGPLTVQETVSVDSREGSGDVNVNERLAEDKNNLVISDVLGTFTRKERTQRGGKTTTVV